jgi:hypothetical protein
MRNPTQAGRDLRFALPLSEKYLAKRVSLSDNSLLKTIPFGCDLPPLSRGANAQFRLQISDQSTGKQSMM